MSLFGIFRDLKPEPSFHDGFNQISVISISNINFKRLLIFLNIEFSVYLVSTVKKENKLPEFVDFSADTVLNVTFYYFRRLCRQSLVFSNVFLDWRVGIIAYFCGSSGLVYTRAHSLPRIFLLFDQLVDSLSFYCNFVVIEIIIKRI